MLSVWLAAAAQWAASRLQPRPLVLLASSDSDMQQLMDSHTYWLELMQVASRQHPSGLQLHSAASFAAAHSLQPGAYPGLLSLLHTYIQVASRQYPSSLQLHSAASFAAAQSLQPGAYPGLLALAGKPEAGIAGVGVSAKLARTLLSRFGSLNAVLAAGEAGGLKPYGAAAEKQLGSGAAAADNRRAAAANLALGLTQHQVGWLGPGGLWCDLIVRLRRASSSVAGDHSSSSSSSSSSSGEACADGLMGGVLPTAGWDEWLVLQLLGPGDLANGPEAPGGWSSSSSSSSSGSHEAAVNQLAQQLSRSSGCFLQGTSALGHAKRSLMAFATGSAKRQLALLKGAGWRVAVVPFHELHVTSAQQQEVGHVAADAEVSGRSVSACRFHRSASNISTSSSNAAAAASSSNEDVEIGWVWPPCLACDAGPVEFAVNIAPAEWLRGKRCQTRVPCWPLSGLSLHVCHGETLLQVVDIDICGTTTVKLQLPPALTSSDELNSIMVMLVDNGRVGPATQLLTMPSSAADEFCGLFSMLVEHEMLPRSAAHPEYVSLLFGSNSSASTLHTVSSKLGGYLGDSEGGYPGGSSVAGTAAAAAGDGFGGGHLTAQQAHPSWDEQAAAAAAAAEEASADLAANLNRSSLTGVDRDQLGRRLAPRAGSSSSSMGPTIGAAVCVPWAFAGHFEAWFGRIVNARGSSEGRDSSLLSQHQQQQRSEAAWDSGMYMRRLGEVMDTLQLHHMWVTIFCV
ncbi:hypothetical protein OEZ85_000895 [Tetradesmus obliquus]|uniref:Uncharacterized protein n=1 Tax=Tetradesmus obliquus TaxID=3088 RepID=A0ABY8UK36_TETOB|nr:hypothetical protein OEZ85_000895 [Tetradesmus obliquus]